MKKLFKIKNKCGMDLSETEELYHGLGHFAQKKFGFKKPPTLHLVSDGDNASKPLGKTAYYDPQGMAVTIYTDNRHTKDILRSLAHELVHHTQNENGMLNDTGYHGVGYAQKNKDLRQSEKEAYLKGNMCFRDWEDSLKQSKPTIYNEWRNIMSTKNWKNNELMENITKKFGFKMDLGLLKEGKEELEVEDGPGTGDENMGITKNGKMVPNPDGDNKKKLKEESGDIDMSFIDKVLERIPVSMNEADMEQMPLDFEQEAKEKAKEMAKKIMDSPEAKKSLEGSEKVDLGTADKLKNALLGTIVGQGYAAASGMGMYALSFIGRMVSDAPLPKNSVGDAINVITASHQGGVELGTAVYAVVAVLSLYGIYRAYKSNKILDIKDLLP